MAAERNHNRYMTYRSRRDSEHSPERTVGRVNVEARYQRVLVGTPIKQSTPMLQEPVTHSIVLSENDAKLFMEELVSPSEPNDKLRSAARKYLRGLGVRND